MEAKDIMVVRVDRVVVHICLVGVVGNRHDVSHLTDPDSIRAFFDNRGRLASIGRIGVVVACRGASRPRKKDAKF